MHLERLPLIAWIQSPYLGEAEKLPQVETFRWRAYDVVISAFIRDGGWDLEYRDPVMTARMKELPPPLEGLFSGLVYLDVGVEDDRAEVRDLFIG